MVPSLRSVPTWRAVAVPNIEFHPGTPCSLYHLGGEGREPGQCAPRPPGGTASPGKLRPVGGRGVSGPASQGPWAGLRRLRSGPKGGALYLLWKRALRLSLQLPFHHRRVAGLGYRKAWVHSPKGGPFQHNFKVNMST